MVTQHERPVAWPGMRAYMILITAQGAARCLNGGKDPDGPRTFFERKVGRIEKTRRSRSKSLDGFPCCTIADVGSCPFEH